MIYIRILYCYLAVIILIDIFIFKNYLVKILINIKYKINIKNVFNV